MLALQIRGDTQMVNFINISSVLKQLRTASGLVAKDVADMLKGYGIEISEKTLYGYESGVSMPNANTFVALCLIYKCENPLDIFRGGSVDAEGYAIMEKYRCLDERGKAAVRNVIDHEYASLAGEEADCLPNNA